MNPRYSYRYWLDGVRVYPNEENSTSKKYDRGDRVFHRETLNGVLIFQRQDWTKIYYQNLDHKFTLIIERENGLGVYPTYITCTFTKIDCNFNYDDKTIRVNATVIDRYENMIAGIDREFDLIHDLKPEISTVVYKKQPLLQVVFPFFPIMFNLVGDTSWIIPIPEYAVIDIPPFGFEELSEHFLFIPGSGDMTPDVSGIYRFIVADTWERADGLYQIQKISLTRFGIVEGATVHYQMPDFEDFPEELVPHLFDTSHIFTAVVSGDTCKAFSFRGFQRMLTDLDTVSGDATIDLPQPDIGDLAFGYTKYVDPSVYPQLFATIFPDDDHTTTPSGYGKFISTALHFAGEYFDFSKSYPVPNEEFNILPVLQKSWTDYFLNISRFGFSTFTTLLEDAAKTITNKDMYEIGEVLKVLIPKLDPLVTFDTTTEHSEFLYSDLNPITGVANLRHFITPKSNVLVGDYDNPDKREIITFGRLVDELLQFAPKLKWWISSDYKFHIEHADYFYNGKSYTTQVISNDLTTQIEPKTGKPWAYHTKQWGYRKDILPERQVNKWMDAVSDPFDGFPIEFISNFVSKGNIDTQSITSFVSDLDFIQAIPERISRDGFCIVSAELVDDVWTVPFTEVDQGNGVVYFIQNGFWSNLYLHKHFHRYNLPSKFIRLNGVNTVALTTKRAREQVISIAGPIEPDMMELITTLIGTGEVDASEVVFSSRQENYTLLHDMDFVNPCPCAGSYKEASWVMYIGGAVDEDLDLSEVVISSFIIDGFEYLSGPVPIGGAATIVNIGGTNWCSNLADTINSLAIGNISAPYPIAADFANSMSAVNNLLRVKMPTCMDIQITIVRPAETGWSFRIIQDGHDVSTDGGDTWVNADTFAPSYGFIWDEQPRIVNTIERCV